MRGRVRSHAHRRSHTCVHAHAWLCSHACVYSHASALRHAYRLVSCVRPHALVCAHLHVYARTHTFACMHSHKCVRMRSLAHECMHASVCACVGMFATASVAQLGLTSRLTVSEPSGDEGVELAKPLAAHPSATTSAAVSLHRQTRTVPSSWPVQTYLQSVPCRGRSSYTDKVCMVQTSVPCRACTQACRWMGVHACVHVFATRLCVSHAHVCHICVLHVYMRTCVRKCVREYWFGGCRATDITRSALAPKRKRQVHSAAFQQATSPIAVSPITWQGCKAARVCGCKDTRVCGCKDTRVEGYKGTAAQEHKG